MGWSIAISTAGGRGDDAGHRSADFSLVVDVPPIVGLVTGHPGWDSPRDLTTPIAERCRRAIHDAPDDPLTAAIEAVETAVAVARRSGPGHGHDGASAALLALGDGEFRYACIGDGVLMSAGGEGGVLRRLSPGHGFGHQLVREGRASFDEGYNHPNRAVLTACVLDEPSAAWDRGSGSIGAETTLVVTVDALAWEIERAEPAIAGLGVEALADRLMELGLAPASRLNSAAALIVVGGHRGQL